MKKQIDRFILSELLSEGGGGSVYKAEEQLPGGVKRTVALKVLPGNSRSDPKAKARFAEEVRTLVAIGGHPNIVTMYSAAISDGTPWIALEYLPLNLEMEITEQPAAVAAVVRMLEHVTQGLAAMHTQTPAVLHNDLKPANVLSDGRGSYKISDFGMSGLATVEKTRVLATVRYAAPELLSRDFGRVMPSTDLYALGHIAFEMSLGGRNYRQQFPAVFDERGSTKEASPAKWMAWHCSIGTAAPAIHELRKDFPQGLSEIIARLMNKDAAQRYSDAPAVLAELKQAAAVPAQASMGRGVVGGGLRTAAPALPIEPAMAPRAGGGLWSASAKPPPLIPEPSGGGGGATMAAGQRYFVKLRGRVSGPFDYAVLQRQVRQGLVSRLHHVSTDQVTWLPAASVEGLFGG